MQENGLNPFIPQRINHKIPSEYVRTVSQFQRNQELDDAFERDMNSLFSYADSVEKFNQNDVCEALSCSTNRARRLVEYAGDRLCKKKLGHVLYYSVKPLAMMSPVAMQHLSTMQKLDDGFMAYQFADASNMHVDSARKVIYRMIAHGLLSKRYEFVPSGRHQMYYLTRRAKNALRAKK
jgi:hypothetical protein